MLLTTRPHLGAGFVLAVVAATTLFSPAQALKTGRLGAARGSMWLRTLSAPAAGEQHHTAAPACGRPIVPANTNDGFSVVETSKAGRVLVGRDPDSLNDRKSAKSKTKIAVAAEGSVCPGTPPFSTHVPGSIAVRGIHRRLSMG